MMFEIDELKEMKLLELQEIAQKIDVPKFRQLKKLDLVYQILDVQAANPKQVLENTAKPNKTKRKRITKNEKAPELPLLDTKPQGSEQSKPEVSTEKPTPIREKTPAKPTEARVADKPNVPENKSEIKSENNPESKPETRERRPPNQGKNPVQRKEPRNPNQQQNRDPKTQHPSKAKEPNQPQNKEAKKPHHPQQKDQRHQNQNSNPKQRG